MNTAKFASMDTAFRREVLEDTLSVRVTAEVERGDVGIDQWTGGELRASYSLSVDPYRKHRAVVCAVLASLLDPIGSQERWELWSMLSSMAGTVPLSLSLRMHDADTGRLERLRRGAGGILRDTLAAVGCSRTSLECVATDFRATLRLPAPDRRTFRVVSRGSMSDSSADVVGLDVVRDGTRRFIRVKDSNGSQTMHEVTELSRFIPLGSLPSLAPSGLNYSDRDMTEALTFCVERFPILDSIQESATVNAVVESVDPFAFARQSLSTDRVVAGYQKNRRYSIAV